MSEIEIQVRYDHERGCGSRKPGGKYLIGEKICAPCGKLPHFLKVCPACGHGIKPMRGWRWIDARAIFGVGPCRGANVGPADFCLLCRLAAPPERAGLIWIGDTFYATPAAFLAEAARLGISRRIAYVPKGFEVGRTLVLLASRKVDRQIPLFTGLGDPAGQVTQPGCGIFAAFVPSALEYVVRGDERQEDLERLSAQGFTLVRIERVTAEGGGGDESGSEGARPGFVEPGPPPVRPPGHGADDRPVGEGDKPGWIV